MQFLLNCGKDFFLIRKVEDTFFCNLFTIEPNSKFTYLSPGINLNINSGFTFYEIRHTDGMQTIVNSNLAITYNYIFHLIPSYSILSNCIVGQFLSFRNIFRCSIPRIIT